MSDRARHRKAKAEKQRIAALPRVADTEAAWTLFRDTLGDVEYDNHRSAFLDDEARHAEYQRILRSGCCGSLDMSVLIDGREFVMGCNYGH